MSMISSGDGSIGVPSKDPGETLLWESGDWRATHRLDGPPLGEGGWGIVQPVVHKESGEPRAVKYPVRDNQEVRARFRREIQVQQQLDHRHVMPVLEFDRATHSWFSMPRAARTLETAACELSDLDIVRVMLHAAAGLGFAHARGLVHRDVKPSNILERADGNSAYPADWLVADFGVVRTPNGSSSIKTTHGLGTEGFMAPEISVSSASVTAAADVYSLGRTLAWLTTSVRPVGYEATLGRGPWVKLVAEMTAFNHGDRLQTMHDVTVGLECVLAELRARQIATWRHQHNTFVLSTTDQRVLATVLNEALDYDASEEAATPQHRIVGVLSMPKALVLLSLRRLIKHGYLTSKMAMGHEESYTTILTTPLAHEWADAHEDQLRELLMRQESAETPF